MPKAERYTRYLFIILSIAAVIDNLYRGDMVTVASAALTILFLLLPPVIERLLKISLPTSFKIIYLVFIIASMYLGEIHSFFYRLPVWDIILHTASAMMLAYITFLMVFVLNRDNDINLKLSPFFIAIFVFCVPVALGAVWEVFEFAVDKIFGVNMIKAIDPNDITRFYDYRRGFMNSLHDMVMDTSGAFIIATGAYIYLKKQGKAFTTFGYLINQFMEKNPSLFSRQSINPD